MKGEFSNGMKAKGQIAKRQRNVRSKIKGTKDRPRISVFRSNRYFFAQIINDELRQTVASVSERSLKDSGGSKTEKAKKLGMLLANLAKNKKLTQAIFDRGRYAYHGRIKAFAEGLREGGLKI